MTLICCRKSLVVMCYVYLLVMNLTSLFSFLEAL